MKTNQFLKQVFVATISFCSTTIFSQTIIKVTASDLHGWDKHEQFLGKISFTDGPAKPPLQKGSLEFNAPVNGHARQVRMRNSNYSGILLSSITELRYATFVQKAGSNRDAPLLVLLVDLTGDGKAGGDGVKDGDIPHITFIPRFQNPNDTTGISTKFGWYKPKKTADKGIRWQHPVRQKVWQTWDLMHSGWVNWTVVNNTVDTSPSIFSLSSFIVQHPNARIINDKRGGGVRIQVGGPDMSDNFIGNVDAFAIGVNGKTTVYDFESGSRKTLGRTKKDGSVHSGIKLNTSTTGMDESSIIKVTDSNLNGWEREEQHLGKISFAKGPSTPPLQKGSLQFDAPENGHERFVRMRNSKYSGILLSGITQLTYSTFIQKAGSKRDAPFIVLLVDADGDGVEDTHMFFDPRHQVRNDTNGIPTKFGWVAPKDTNDKSISWQGPVYKNVWQTWDALHGAWVTWSTSTSKGDPNPPLYSLTSFIAQNPSARIVNGKGGGGVRLQAGGVPMANNFLGNADAFAIGINGRTTIYDFELGTDTARRQSKKHPPKSTGK